VSLPLPLPLPTGAAVGGTAVRDLGQLAALLPAGRLHGLRGPCALHGIALHTDQVQPGSLFACVRGERHDGHDWATLAVQRGAVALLVERHLPALADTPQLEVPDARVAVAHCARAFHGRPDQRLLVLAVTGTNGKTTTTFMLHAIFAAAGLPLGVIGTVCYRLGRSESPALLTTPDAVRLYGLLAEGAAAGLHGVALEASSHALSQGRLEGLEVDTAIFTNLSHDHLDYHGSPMAYFAAKRRLFAPRPGSKQHPSLAVVSADRPAGRLLARLVHGQRRVVTCGLGPGVDVQGDLEAGPGGRPQLRYRGLLGAGSLPLPLPGRHNARNALAALTAALLNGVPPAAAADGLAAMPPVPGRLEPVDDGQDVRVLVDFAHNPHGLRCALDAARSLCARRLLLVFGCKGEDGDGDKRRRMGMVAGRLADEVILTTDDPYGERPEDIAAAVRAGLEAVGATFRVELDRERAIGEAIARAGAGDVVLVAGRGHEAWQPGPGGRVPLDDRAICRGALQQRRAASARTPRGAPAAAARA
jgi:UDP-N-acetylmuramoyl-L-alanyl-D-glutamate--2,6-diaminopimelate ligase